MSTAQFGREMTHDRIARLLDEATGPRRARRRFTSPRLAAALRRAADRLDSPCRDPIATRFTLGA